MSTCVLSLSISTKDLNLRITLTHARKKIEWPNPGDSSFRIRSKARCQLRGCDLVLRCLSSV